MIIRLANWSYNRYRFRDSHINFFVAIEYACIGKISSARHLFYLTCQYQTTSHDAASKAESEVIRSP